MREFKDSITGRSKDADAAADGDEEGRAAALAAPAATQDAPAEPVSGEVVGERKP
jgi:hypothetical protein